MLRQHRLKFLGPLAGVTRRENFRNENIWQQFGVGSMIQKLWRVVRDWRNYCRGCQQIACWQQ
jgi:hypothetical protein